MRVVRGNPGAKPGKAQKQNLFINHLNISIMEKTTSSTDFKKLEFLAERVNKRFRSGLNDDDQVKQMFDFAKTTKEAFIIIKFDTYDVLTPDEKNFLIKKHLLNKKESENFTSFETTKGNIILFN